ncbi:zf-C2HC5-domain-containing protein [Parathielavia appendiculata]|uniref:Zf-C2HC5-domain-containing protein n=1 Tax=Parathielavia appendiculata TaxID=2587402 RepID=A0AAN6TRN4_9PEZI|nr:zf-C2HC5-domain-containing protein [Parathielavia appendiculata]
MSKEQLFQLLPLPDDGLQQVLEYAATLSKAEAAEHFINMLGDSPQVIDFISTFNARRAEPIPAPATAPATAPSSNQNSDVDHVPKHRRGPKKKKPPLHTLPPRQVASFELASGTVYNKKDQEEVYISGKSGTSTPSSSNAHRNGVAAAKAATPPPQPSKPPPSAAGTLVSELGVPKPKPKSNPVSRTSTPGPSSSRNTPSTTKVSITGGIPMHGSSTALADLDQAIRSLELTTNPSHTSNSASNLAARRCNCVATRHPLLEAAPNCLNCGKVICIKEGLGPCTFCEQPLLSSGEVQSMIRELRAERGREKQALDREAHKRAEATRPPKPFRRPGVDDKDDLTVAEAMALQHRDKLLSFQAQNARRTTVRDEAADFDVTDSGSMWASPEERALALKRQQRLLREMEWNARPEYEKRQQVVSIDLTGRKVFKKMAKVERPPSPEEEDTEGEDNGGPISAQTGGARGHGGAFSKNPLLGGLIRPVYDPKGKGVELEGRKDRSARWRKVQDDLDDNEAVILDGGMYGRTTEAQTAGLGGDEPECG